MPEKDAPIALPSGVTLADSLSRLRAFCREEYDYYDKIRSEAPNAIEPIDVLVTVAMNSFINNAVRVRAVHRGLSRQCNSVLAQIPEDANLINELGKLDSLHDLFDAAIQVPGVLIPVATKVLHRKRRSLIPMLDNVLIGHYVDKALLPTTQNKQRAASIAIEATLGFREDLTAAYPRIKEFGATLLSEGYHLTPLRILELLIWMEKEPSSVGYYRSLTAAS